MNVQLIKAFIASPGDTNEERIIVEELVDEINNTRGDNEDFRLELLKWETHAYPSFGEDGQDVINRQIGDDYDIFIGVMWKRFGTPTKRSESGTLEEFTRAYDRYKAQGNVHVMFYFNKDNLPQDTDLDQFKKVQEFKGQLPSLGGLYWEYSGQANFEKQLRNHLNKAVSEFLKKKAKNQLNNEVETEDDSSQISIKPEFVKYLNDTEVNFAHSKVNEITLDDIYIAPDLTRSNPGKNSKPHFYNLTDIANTVDEKGIKFIMLGNELSGKTASCKYLYFNYFNLDYIPVLIDGNHINNNIRSETIIKIVEQKLIEQYSSNIKLNRRIKPKIVLIIDNFHKSSKGRSKYWHVLIKNIEKEFSNIILTGDALMPLESVSKYEPFKNFDTYSILEFGPKYRAQLVKKWNTLGVDERYVDINEQFKKNDESLSQIQTVIGKGYVPSYPFYLLTLLQAMESGSVQNPNYSIHGFYYELLINDALQKAVEEKKEISLYYNYMTNLCYRMFVSESKSMSIANFQEFHEDYCRKYDLSYNYEKIVRQLDNAKLLKFNSRLHVPENYIYYFFIAKYLANNISKDSIKDVVTKMSVRVFRDEYASIIMFLTHLSKDGFIIDELVKNARSIFSEISPLKLEGDIEAINKLIKTLPSQVLELVDVKDKRNEVLEAQEEEERLEREYENEKISYDDFGLDASLETIDFYAKITLALKTIDILGQVVKKHWGELEGDQKSDLVEETYNLGLRTVGFYYKVLEDNTDVLVEYLDELIRKRNIKKRYNLKKDIEETASDHIFKLCFIASYGVTKRVADAVGYDKLKNTFERVLEQNPYNSVKLIDFAIKSGNGKLPFKELDGYHKDMKNNNMSYLLLKNIVVDYLYMFDTDHKEKGKICSLLEIEMREQNRIDQVSRTKRTSH